LNFFVSLLSTIAGFDEDGILFVSFIGFIFGSIFVLTILLLLKLLLSWEIGLLLLKSSEEGILFWLESFKTEVFSLFKISSLSLLLLSLLPSSFLLLLLFESECLLFIFILELLLELELELLELFLSELDVPWTLLFKLLLLYSLS